VDDLCDRYVSPRRYIVEAAERVMIMIASQVRRSVNI